MVQNLKDILDRLEIWRKERGLAKSQGFEFDLNTQVSFLTEEITEYLRAKKDYERIDALCDLSVFSLNAINGLDNNYDDLFSEIYHKAKRVNFYSIANIIDRLPYMFRKGNDIKFNFMDVVEISRWIIEDMGYDYFKCMDETLKEVESRKGAFNPESGKWEKFKDEESQKLWYKADYNSCKIVA